MHTPETELGSKFLVPVLLSNPESQSVLSAQSPKYREMQDCTAISLKNLCQVVLHRFRVTPYLIMHTFLMEKKRGCLAKTLTIQRFCDMLQFSSQSSEKLSAIDYEVGFLQPCLSHQNRSVGKHNTW